MSYAQRTTHNALRSLTFPPMHLYIHVPFCARRCSYCDFAIAVRREVPSASYVDTVLAEWRMWREREGGPPADTLATLYLGGGTPSLLAPDEMDRLVGTILKDAPLLDGAEVTLEANPDDVTGERAGDWVRLGINRVSLGAQSFSPAALRWMHRGHRPEQVERAVTHLRGAGIEDVSLDLIYGLPRDIARDWEDDLSRALALDPTHLSLYGLTVEAHTPLAKWVGRGRVRPAADEVHAVEFLAAHSVLETAGFDHYEVSNACRPGYRARHNSAYWRRADYIGLGPSAHSAWGRHRQWNVRQWEAYRREVVGGGGRQPVAGAEDLTAREVRLEEVYLGLRTSDGVPGGHIQESVSGRWRAAGWAEVGPERVRLTPEGWLRLDALVGEVAEPELN